MSLAQDLAPDPHTRRIILDPAALSALAPYAGLLKHLLGDKPVTLTDARLGSSQLTGTVVWGQETGTAAIGYTGEELTGLSLHRRVADQGLWSALGLPVRAVTERISAVPWRDGITAEVTLTARLRIAGHWVEATAGHSDAGLRLEMACQGLGLGLPDLVTLIGRDPHPDGDLQWLPEALRNPARINIDRLVLLLDPARSVPLLRAELDLSLTTNDWPVMPGLAFPTVGAITAVLAVDHPLEPDLRLAEVTLAGQIRVDDRDSPIQVRAQWPDLRLRGALPADGRIDLGRACRVLGLSVAGLPHEPGGGLALTGLELTGRPTGRRRRFAMTAALEAPAPRAGEAPWTIRLGPSKRLALDALGFALDWQENGGHGAWIEATATLHSEPPGSLPPPEFTVTAREADGAWTLAGRWETDPANPLHLGDWLDDFAHGLDPGIELPDLLRALTVSQVALGYETGPRRLAAAVSAASGATAVRLDLAAMADPAGGWTIRGEGRLSHGALTFRLVLDREKGRRLLAVLEADSPVRATLAELAQALGLGGGWPDTTLSFEAAVAVDDDPANGGAVRLAALDLGAGADLTGLPLLGPLLTDTGAFAVAFQLTYGSRAMTASAEDGALVAGGNQLLPAPATPLPEARDIPAGPHIVALLKTGDDSTKLDLAMTPRTGAQDKVQLPAAPVSGPAPDGIAWTKIDRHFGPVHLVRAGLTWDGQGPDPAFGLRLDAALAMGPVTFALSGLGVTVTLPGATPAEAKVRFHLDGLGLDYRSGAIRIAAALLRSPSGDDYAGTALIETQALSLSAIGAYRSADEGKSLFVYGVLDKPLGGPSFFFVTGLAAGFGYNRALVVPPVAAVADFPLVAQAVAGGMPDDLGAELETLRTAVPVAWDEHFLAAGLKFNSFGLIDSFALLAVQFGRTLEIDLLGLSSAVLPPPEAGRRVAPLAKIEVALKATFRPDEGVLRLKAQLTKASFLLDRRCRLRGGFAFYAWLKDQPGSGASAGDFVVTLGGYHPHFRLDHHPAYPRVPRVAVDWPVSRQVEIKGDLYCALTPGAIMAGGHVSATFHDGAIRAWFKAGIDFMMMWKPFHYEGRVYVDIGGAYTYHFFGTHTISIDVGADLTLWGPAFAGNAHVSLYIVSFDIPIGHGGPPVVSKLTWETFVDSFLPPPARMLGTSLVQGRRSATGKTPQVDPAALRVEVDGALPATQLTCGRFHQQAPVALGVAPMALAPGGYTATHTITIDVLPEAWPGKPPPQTQPADHLFTVEARRKQAPAALWGAPPPGLRADVQTLNAGHIGEALHGVTLTPAAAQPVGQTHRLSREALVEGVAPASAVVTVAAVGGPVIEDLAHDATGAARAPEVVARETGRRIGAAMADRTTARRRAQLLRGFGHDPAGDRPGTGVGFRMPPAIRTDRVTVE